MKASTANPTEMVDGEALPSCIPADRRAGHERHVYRLNIENASHFDAIIT